MGKTFYQIVNEFIGKCDQLGELSPNDKKRSKLQNELDRLEHEILMRNGSKNFNFKQKRKPNILYTFTWTNQSGYEFTCQTITSK